MGLTVHYDYEFEGKRKELIEILDEIAEDIVKLRPRKVWPPVYVDKLETTPGYAHFDEDRFVRNDLGFMLLRKLEEKDPYISKEEKMVWEARGTLNIPNMPMFWQKKYYRIERKATEARRKLRQKVLERGEGVALYVNVAEGCEPFTVMLARLRGSRKWVGSSFTKTQYAKDFLRAHLMVITMLDICNEHGILKSVYDEGGYYETRDIERLCRNLNANTATLLAVGEILQGISQRTGGKLKVQRGGVPQIVVPPTEAV